VAVIGAKKREFSPHKMGCRFTKARWSSWDIGNFDPNINVPPRRKINSNKGGDAKSLLKFFTYRMKILARFWEKKKFSRKTFHQVFIQNPEINTMIPPHIICVLLLAVFNFAIITDSLCFVHQLGSRNSGQSALGAKGFGSSPAKKSGGGGGDWRTLNVKASDLPVNSGDIKVIDTGIESLSDPLTNPNGAIAAGRYGDDLYAFSSLCTQCKIPLNKGKFLETPTNAVHLKCSFCSSEFDLTAGGIQVEATAKDGSNIFGNIVGSMVKGQNKKPIKVFKLASDKEGYINLKMP